MHLKLYKNHLYNLSRVIRLVLLYQVTISPEKMIADILYRNIPFLVHLKTHIQSEMTPFRKSLLKQDKYNADPDLFTTVCCHSIGWNAAYVT